MDFSNLKVLVIGDVALDMLIEGPSYRQSPEAPVPVILNPTATYSLGMAANVALNFNNLGADVAYIFSVGKDKYGSIIEELLKKNFGSVAVTKTDGNMATTTKQRIIANNQQIARIDFEDKANDFVIKSLIEKLTNRVIAGKHYDLIIISDYNKGIITEESWSNIKPLLLQLSDKFFVDTKKKNVLDFYEGMYIFPNKKEMQDIMDFNNCKTRNELRDKMNLDFIIETASEEGAYLYKNDGKMYHCPVFKSNVLDVTGCGDTFVAAFSLFYAKYNNKKAALAFANYCCSKVIEKKGTVTINISEVLDFDSKSF